MAPPHTFREYQSSGMVRHVDRWYTTNVSLTLQKEAPGSHIPENRDPLVSVTQLIAHISYLPVVIKLEHIRTSTA
jgi:hypothetical protein